MFHADRFQIATEGRGSYEITDQVQGELTKSFAGAEAVAQQYPQYASQITAAAQESFLKGDSWAYTAGLIAVLLGAALVFFMFPRKDEEQRLLAQYQATDAEVDEASTTEVGRVHQPAQ